MTNIGKYYNYLSLSEATTTTSFSSGDKDEDKYNQYSPSGMFTTSATQTAQSADGGDWDGGRHHDDDDDEGDLEPDPSIGDIPERVEQLWDYVDWWVDLLPQFEGAANTISRLMVQPSMSPQDWYDFFYELFGFGHQGGGIPSLPRG